MSRVIRASIIFDYYPDEDPITKDMDEEGMLEYVKASCVDDIYSLVKYGEVNQAILLEIL